jgi:putative ABC transport system permease protein
MLFAGAAGDEGGSFSRTKVRLKECRVLSAETELRNIYMNSVKKFFSSLLHSALSTQHSALHLRLIRFVGLIVPRRLRPGWRQEWEAELRWREMMLSEWDQINWRAKLGLLWHSLGAFWDALWLQTYRWEDEMLQDLRFGGRMLRKNPGFTVVAVLSLALGIGANTAIFQLLNAVRLRTLPVQSPQELAEVRIVDMNGARGHFSSDYPVVTNPIWEQIRDRQQAFSGIYAWSADAFNLAQGGEIRLAHALWVSGDFFNVLGVRPILGRVFNASDDQRGCGAPGVVISHAFWQREFGGAADVIGRKLTLDRGQYEIIGVTPASFFGLDVGRSFDLAVPICGEAVIRGAGNRLKSGTSWWLTVTGRLKPDWSLEKATAHLQTISPSLFEATLPANYPPISVKNYLGFKLQAIAAGRGVSRLRETYEDSLWMLMTIAGLVLLIACANLANLMLARANVRAREIAVRQALGASRGRLIRQLLVESLLLAFIGTALGALLARGLSRLLVSFISTTNNVIFLDLGLDWRIFGFAIGLAALTCLLFGLTPALRATRVAPGAVMKSSGRGLTAGRERFGLRRVLVVTQVALSVILVAGALLFSRSLGKLLTVETGFRQDGILIANIGFGRLNVAADRRQAFRKDLIERFRAIPGVESAADASLIPMSGSAWGNNVWMDGVEPRQTLDISFSEVGQNYFQTFETPLLAGRDFDDRDTTTSPKVAIVNEAFARQLLIGASPVGRRFRVEATPSRPETAYEIVGLVKNTKYSDLREEFRPIAFLPSTQSIPGPGGQFLIRSSLPLNEVSAAVKRIVGEISPAINISFRVLKTQIETSVLRERLVATLSGFFGLLALVLASIGLYGLLSYNVAGRTSEIGLRMALGARARDVLWMILREALLLTVIGIVVGLPAVIYATKWVESLLYGLQPTDPISIGFAAILLLAVAALAAWLPARRAARVDPMIALRYE